MYGSIPIPWLAMAMVDARKCTKLDQKKTNQDGRRRGEGGRATRATLGTGAVKGPICHFCADLRPVCMYWEVEGHAGDAGG